MFKNVSRILGIIGTVLAVVLCVVLYVESVEGGLFLALSVPMNLLTIVLLVVTFVSMLLLGKMQKAPGILLIASTAMVLCDIVIYIVLRLLGETSTSVLISLPFAIVPLVVLALALFLYYAGNKKEE